MEHPLRTYRNDDVEVKRTSKEFATQSIDLTPEFKINTELEVSDLIVASLSIQELGGKVLRLKGIVDTAAQVPILSASFCHKHKIKLLPLSRPNLRPVYFDGRLQLASWQTESLTVRYAPKCITTSVFMVLESITGHDCLIGGILREKLGLNNATSVSTEWMDDNIDSISVATVTVPIHRILTVPPSPPRNSNQAPIAYPQPDDDFITQHWSDVPTANPYDLPLSYSGSAPTRQHVVDHPDSEKDAEAISIRLPAIMEALNQNNVVTAAPNFIVHPDAVIHLEHEKGTDPKFIPQPRGMPERKRMAVRLQIEKWLRTGKIRYLRPDERHSWNSQILTAPKPGSFETDGTQKLRVCFNGKPTVNIGLKLDHYQLPKISDVLNKCAGSSFFTELDCEDAYLQMILDSESQSITAFEFESKTYCFVGSPYGITFIGNTFQRVMTKIFQDMPFVQVYVDNIWVISGDDYDLHLNHVLAVIARCNERKIRLNLKKPVLFKREFVGFGHHVSAAGISLDPKKQQSALSWDPESLTTCGMLSSFLGATNYLRENIRHYTELTYDLQVASNAHLTPKAHIVWTPSLRESFRIFQEAIAHAPLIHYADHTRQFALATDASRVAYGCVLFQPRVPGEQPNADNIVSFFSRSLLNHERGYAAYKLELLSVVNAIRRYHDFVWGTHFLLYTDHQSLTHIWNMKDFNNTYAGWILELADYSFDIRHVPGLKNIFPDVLSRLYRNKTWGLTESNELAPAMPPTLGHEMRPNRDNTLRAHIYSVLTPITHPDGSSDTTVTSSASTASLNVVPCVSAAAEPTHNFPPPTADQLDHIRLVHSAGHYGVKAVYNRLKTMSHNWKYMLQHVQQEVASCTHCQQWSIVKRGYQPLRSPVAWWPFDIVQFDLATSLPTSSSGNTVLLVLVDILTGFTLLRPLRDKQASTIATALMGMFGDFGTPRVIHSDNEATMVSDVLEKFYSYLGTLFQTSIPFNPHSLGKAERGVGCALQCIHKLLSASGGEWDRMAPFAQLCLNTKIKDLTGTDPFVLMFNRTCHIFDFDSWSKDTSKAPNIKTINSLENWTEHQLKLESIVFPAIRDRISAKQKRSNAAFAASHMAAPTNIPIGTLVAIKDVHRTNKNEPTMLSPYTVHSRAANGGYMVRDMAGGILARAVPVEHIRPLYHARKPDTSGIAYMDYIYDKRVNSSTNRDEYLVKWSGMPLTESTWLDVADINDYAAITQYLATLERIPKTRKLTRQAVQSAAKSDVASKVTSKHAVASQPLATRKPASHAAIAQPTFQTSSRGRISKRLY